MSTAGIKLFVTGIGTDVGKTVASAVLCESLGANYWKPIQSGSLEHSDSDTIKALITNGHERVFPERFRLRAALSPHAAARLEHVNIKLSDFCPPPRNAPLVIEGAGGLMVPINLRSTMADLVAKLEAPLILVVRHYLGSINHTLLTLSAIKALNLACKGIIVSGEQNTQSEHAIKRIGGVPIIAHIPAMKRVSRSSISAVLPKFAPRLIAALS